MNCEIVIWNFPIVAKCVLQDYNTLSMLLAEILNYIHKIDIINFE